MTTLLLVHITAAVTTLTTCLYAWYKPSRAIQKIFTFLTTISLGSGVIVSLNQLFTRATCVKLGVYLLILTSTYWHLHVRQKASDLLESPLHE